MWGIFARCECEITRECGKILINLLFFFSSHKIVQVAAFLFGGAPDLTGAFARMEAGGNALVHQLVLFRGNIHIMFDGLAVLYPVVQKGGYFDQPFAAFGFDIVFIANGHGTGSLYGGTVHFYLATFAGSSGLGAGFEDTDGPEVFIDTEFFGVLHNLVRGLTEYPGGRKRTVICLCQPPDKILIL